MCVHAGNEPSKFSAYPLSFLGLVFLIVVGWFVLFWFCPPPPPANYIPLIQNRLRKWPREPRCLLLIYTVG